MMILHGWLNVRGESKPIRDLFRWLEGHEGFRISQLGMNGETMWSVFSCRNGFSPSVTKFLDGLSNALKHESPDTYGLIFLLNEEDKMYFNTWQVWAISKNEMREESDSYLSPYSEKIAFYPDENL
jgi:hypothetical protein